MVNKKKYFKRTFNFRLKWIKTEWNAMDFIICIHFDYPFWQWSLILFFPLFHSNIWYDWIFERAEPKQQQLKQSQQHVTIGSIANGFTMLSSLLHIPVCPCIQTMHLLISCFCTTSHILVCLPYDSIFFSIKKGKRKHKVDYEKERKKKLESLYTKPYKIESNRCVIWHLKKGLFQILFFPEELKKTTNLRFFLPYFVSHSRDTLSSF